MSFLAIDIGNTRLKWALYAADARPGTAPLQHGAVFLENIDRLADQDWLQLPAPQRVLGSNVAGDAVRRRVEEQMEHWDLTPRWVVPSVEAAGIRNGYDHPTRLGADRWIAVIGARAQARLRGFEGPVLTVMVGTAVTVDALSSDNQFLGGLAQSASNFPAGSGLTYFMQLGNNWDVAMNALASDSRVNVVQRPRVLQPERSARGPGERPEVAAAPEVPAQVAGDRPDVGPGRASDLQGGGGPLGIAVVPRGELQRMDRHRTRGQLRLAAVPGQLVGPPSTHVDRGMVRRHLRDRSAIRREGGFHRRPVRCRRLAGGQLAVAIVRRRGRAEDDDRAVPLLVTHVVLDEAGRMTQEDRQDPAREGVEGAAMADAPDAREPADDRHHVMGGGAGRLADDEDPVQAGRGGLRGVAHRRSASSRTSASA